MKKLLHEIWAWIKTITYLLTILAVFTGLWWLDKVRFTL